MIYRGWRYTESLLAMRSIRVVTQPTEEQVSLDEARQHLRLDTYGSPDSHPDDDMLEQVYIPGARAICEAISGRAFVPQILELGVGGFPRSWLAFDRNGIALKMGPVRGVTSVAYSDGTQSLTLDPSAYVVDPYTDGGYIYPAYGTCWPSEAMNPRSVLVRFAAGYDGPGASPADMPLPPDYKLALLLALGHVYENRENTTTFDLKEIPLGINALLKPSSLVNGFA